MDERAVEENIRDLAGRLARLEDAATAQARTLRSRLTIALVVAALGTFVGFSALKVMSNGGVQQTDRTTEGARGGDMSRTEMAAARAEDAARRSESSAARLEAAAARAEAAAQKAEQIFVKLQHE
jgi:hypothetical protein